MPTVPLYNQTGQKIGTVDLDPKIFAVRANPGLIEEVVAAHMANRRQTIAHTQTKGEVRGGGRKPWKQKGTGRARHGSIRSPQWKGGGVIFGPRSNRNFSVKVNVSAKRKALRMALSDKANHERLNVIDTIVLPDAKTKQMAGVLAKLPQQKKTLIILSSTDRNLVRAGRNIPGLTFIRADSLNLYDIINHQQVLVLQPALPVISKTFGA